MIFVGIYDKIRNNFCGSTDRY